MTRRRRAGGRYTAPKRALYLLPDIPDAGTEALKNGLAIRNEATLTGHCRGCGESATLGESLEAGRVVVVSLGHLDGCPALLEGLE